MLLDSDNSPSSGRRNDPTALYRNRWAGLAVVCAAVFVTTLDGTIVNVAIPSLSSELGATTRQLQWIVDAYLLVFSGLLLAAGGLGDRFGRRRLLISGLVVFGATSIYAGSVDTAGELIAGRALMGIGAAGIFPATLAIITHLFTDRIERAKAIGVWSAMSGVGVAAGPIGGGWLLEHFWWGSVFFINVPIALITGIFAWRILPESRDDEVPPLDRVGLLLSIATIGALVFTIIEAPEFGWLSPTTIGGFMVAAILLAAFLRWELHVDAPLLPVRIFENLRFSAASAAITSAFFALFGFIFLITQYLQLVLGHSPFEAGVRTLPVALSIGVASVISPRLVEVVGTKVVVSTSLAIMSVGFAWVSTSSASTPYIEIVGQMVVLGVGLGATTAPATESIMGSLPQAKAGVGSAVNDTTRELGGTLGVAVIGSVFSSVYVSSLRDGPAFDRLPSDVQQTAEESMVAAGMVASSAGDAALLAEVSDAFLSGLATSCYVVAAAVLAGSLVALGLLPARSRDVPTI